MPQGEQITRAGARVAKLSPRVRRAASRRLLHRIADAYGHMMLVDGLFQADAHPGNILVMRGALNYQINKVLQKSIIIN